jgi:hypothetical protein
MRITKVYNKTYTKPNSNSPEYHLPEQQQQQVQNNQQQVFHNLQLVG